MMEENNLMKIEWSSEFQGSPEPQWFYTKGHVNKAVFLVRLEAALAENIWDLPADWLIDGNYLSVENVSLEWWHFYPTGRKDIKGAYAQVSGPGRGNFPITVYNLDYPMGDSEDVGLLLQGDP